MKTFVYIIVIGFIIISTLLSLPYLLSGKVKLQYTTDNALREVAISKGLKSTPTNYDDLLKIFHKNKNEMSVEKIDLGKELYYDSILSKGKDVSCASCHLLPKETKQSIFSEQLLDKNTQNNCTTCHIGDESGVDRMSSSLGTKGIANPYHLNTMTILNSSLAKSFTWSGEVRTLEDEVLNSIKSHHKMNLEPNVLEERLKNNQKYQELFKKAFEEEDPITILNIQKTISSYVRTLLTRGSFDNFIDGNNSAISYEAKKGLINFMNFGCAGCHTGMSVGGQSIQRFPLRHFAGIHDLRPNIAFDREFKIVDNTFPFENIGGYLGRANTKFFRVPILRNVTKTSPYFHNGSVDKIREAVEIMGRHQLGKNLSNKQADEIVEFLKTLEGKRVDYMKKSEK